ncbi:unnamed protein product [Prorocentrum cordatum]|uniref:Endonuclease/exonuclease/phosphatase domain-containing protein n=1 Tax=Prorocentrum cordatum TaxID=2364126 RepID=A0ABN9UDA8_9DINO|nr:unnamed protein product [Polarella glacialis]
MGLLLALQRVVVALDAGEERLLAATTPAAAADGGDNKPSAKVEARAQQLEGVAKLATALRTVTESTGTLKLANGDDIAKQLTGVADALNVPEKKKPPKSKAVRLAEAAKALDSATCTYNWAYGQKVLAEAKAAKARERLQESAGAVVSAEAEIEAIQNEGKQKAPKSIFEQLLDADADLLSPSDVQIAEVEDEFRRDEDLDAEGKKAVDEAKRQVLEQLQRNAREFAGQLKQHLQAAKAKAEQERVDIQQAFKKRKAEQQTTGQAADAPTTVAPPTAGASGSATQPDNDTHASKVKARWETARHIFSANITTWGPAVLSWLRRDGILQPYDVYAIQETHLPQAQLADTEHTLQNMGFSAVFTAARARTNSPCGTCGGTGVLAKGRPKATTRRHRGERASVSDATTYDADDTHATYRMCDWTPNSMKLTSLAAFLAAARAPWTICGDFNRSYADLVQSGWTTALGATAYAGLDDNQRARFLGDAKPPNIDYALHPQHRRTTMDGADQDPMEEDDAADYFDEFEPERDAHYSHYSHADTDNMHDPEVYAHVAAEAQRTHARDMAYTDDHVNSALPNDLDCDEAQRAPEQKPLLEQLAERANGTDTRAPDDTWTAASDEAEAMHSRNNRYENSEIINSDTHPTDPTGGAAWRTSSVPSPNFANANADTSDNSAYMQLDADKYEKGSHHSHTKYAPHDEHSSKSTASNSDEDEIISPTDHLNQTADAHLPPTTWPGHDGERVGCALAAPSAPDETPALQQYETGSSNKSQDNHRDKRLRLLFSASGSVVLSSCPVSILSAIVAVALDYIFSQYGDELELIRSLKDDWAISTVGIGMSFAIVFRTQIAWSRYWEAAQEVTTMWSKWGDSFLNMISFANSEHYRSAAAAHLCSISMSTATSGG